MMFGRDQPGPSGPDPKGRIMETSTGTTREHLAAFYAQATGGHALADVGIIGDGYGSTLAWRIGADHDERICATCESTVSSGQQLVAQMVTGSGIERKNQPWCHVRCFDWSTRIMVGASSAAGKTPLLRNSAPTSGQIEKQLPLAAMSPRFRMTTRAAADIASAATHIDRSDGKPWGNRARAVASALDRIAADGTRIVIGDREPLKITYQAGYAPATTETNEPSEDIMTKPTTKPTTKPARAPRRSALPAPPPAPHVGVVMHDKPSAAPATVTAIATHSAYGIAAPAPVIVEKAALPQWAETWLATLVFETKRNYAREYLAHLLLAERPAPAANDAEWAHKARKRADWLTKANRAG